MDPYETLGVSKTATAQEIKRARRQKAKRLHPDRNHGDTAKMAEVNLAHDILIDPVRRANYEKTGYSRVTTDEEEARKMVVEGMLQMMNSRQRMNIPKRMERAIRDTLTKVPINRSHLTSERAYFQGRVDELATSDSMNLWRGIVEQQIDALDGKLAQLEREERIAKKALEIVQLYRSGVTEEMAPIFRPGAGLDALLREANRAAKGG